ncbi:MAG: fatty acid oxidation complex subunit alpha FadJ [Myxococcales bacterium]|nr:fatty acid oxidation complex subunit alpha FadJ [Myxococcales bacterium]
MADGGTPGQILATTPSLRLEAPDSDGVATLWIDCPGKKVNTLSVALLPEFETIFAALQAQRSVRAIVVASAKESGFIAGADIDDLGAVKSASDGVRLSAQGQAAMARIENLSIPAVAAIHGECLGGGLELALACRARVVSLHPKTKLALPEVMLGLLPGAGGTVRLPKLVGLADALDMMLTGKNIRAEKAVRMGLANAAVPPGQLLTVARRYARDLADGKPVGDKPKQTIQAEVQKLLLEQNVVGRKLVLHEARKKVMAQTKGLYPAPLDILDVVGKGTYEAEAQAFGKLLLTPESRGLRHLFHAITHCKKDEAAGIAGVVARPVARVGMLGAGLMGAGIATVLANNEMAVRLKDRDYEAIGRSIEYARKVYGKARKRKVYGEAGVQERLARISGGTDWAGFGRCEVVIEAVFEDLDLKQRMVAEIERVTKTDGIFASNTSSLPIAEIAAKAAHPERVIGMHFFSPVEKMPLVEIIVTPQTAPEVIATTVAVARKMGKHVIVVNDCAGFYTTRALVPYMTEATFLLWEGYAVEDIDAAAARIGFPVGPITLMDEVGIDVGLKVMKVMKHYYGERLEFPPDVSAKFVEEGRLGRKANKGFYVYDPAATAKKGGKKPVDPAVYAALPRGTKTRAPDLDQMGERMVLGLVNEAVRCLEDGTLRDAWAGDLGAVMGIGFPPFEGGPFQYVDRYSARVVVDKLRNFQSKFGRRFDPTPRLVQMAQTGATFFG